MINHYRELRSQPPQTSPAALSPNASTSAPIRHNLQRWVSQVETFPSPSISFGFIRGFSPMLPNHSNILLKLLCCKLLYGLSLLDCSAGSSRSLAPTIWFFRRFGSVFTTSHQKSLHPVTPTVTCTKYSSSTRLSDESTEEWVKSIAINPPRTSNGLSNRHG